MVLYYTLSLYCTLSCRTAHPLVVLYIFSCYCTPSPSIADMTLLVLHTSPHTAQPLLIMHTPAPRLHPREDTSNSNMFGYEINRLPYFDISFLYSLVKNLLYIYILHSRQITESRKKPNLKSNPLKNGREQKCYPS